MPTLTGIGNWTMTASRRTRSSRSAGIQNSYPCPKAAEAMSRGGSSRGDPYLRTTWLAVSADEDALMDAGMMMQKGKV
jgi:hypothetical protein